MAGLKHRHDVAFQSSEADVNVSRRRALSLLGTHDTPQDQQWAELLAELIPNMINDSFLPSLTDERPLRVCWLTASTARRVQARTQGLQRLIESAMPSLDGLPAVPHMTTNPIADWASLWAKFRNDRAPREVRKLARQWHEQGVSRPWLMEFYLGTREAWDRKLSPRGWESRPPRRSGSST